MFADPKKHLPERLAKSIGTTLCSKWSRLPDARRALLKLVSRFEVAPEQATVLYVQEERAKAGIDTRDAVILANPYLLYELTRLTADPISVWTIDRGVFPDEVIREKHPLPAPTALDAGTDARRVRTFTIKVLEDAAGSGNTLLPQDQLVLGIRGLALQPRCEVDADLMNVAKDDFEDAVGELTMANGDPALIQALKGVHRLILIGDPRQLPPIGAGRPFVDIVKHLVPKGVTEKFPRVGPGYAELTGRRRQAGEDREDLRFAEWFSGSPIAAGEDDVFDNVVRAGLSRHVRFEQWETADDIRSRLIDRTQGG